MKGAKKRERRKQNGEGSSKPVPNINTSRSEKASPETARALPTIGKQTNIQTVKLKYVNKEMTPVKGRDEESKQKWYEKANKKAEDEMLRKQKEKEVLAAPGKKKKVLTTEPATPTRLDLGEETIGERKDGNTSSSISNFLNGNGTQNASKILTTPFHDREGKTSDEVDEGKCEEKERDYDDYQAIHKGDNDEEGKYQEEDIWAGYNHSHLPGNEYTEGDGQVQYDEYGGYYDEHGQYYDCHGGYYDEHGEYVYPENYQHEEYEQDGQGGYDHRDGHDAAQADPEENYEGKNQEQNDMYRKSEMNQSKYTPYKHGGKPAVSPLRSPFPRQDTQEHQEGKSSEDHEESKECDKEEGATARRVRTMFQSDRSPAQTLTGRNRMEKKISP